MKYRCLILDHDDTCVDSTRTIHYAAFRETMKEIRPGRPIPELEEFFSKNFHPGFMEYMTGELGFSEKEMEKEFEIWTNFTRERTPEFFPGFLDGLKAFKERGGIVTVVSHSQEQDIRRFYQEKGEGFMPDAVFGWDHDPEKRKPAPYPVEQILSQFDLEPSETLVVDDLKPGIVMAHSAGVDAAAASWSHNIPVIRTYMEEKCVTVLDSHRQLWEFLG